MEARGSLWSSELPENLDGLKIFHHRSARVPEPYVCMYVALYVGPSFKTMLGASVQSDKLAKIVAAQLVSSIAQDVTGRWNQTLRTRQVEILEACRFLTQSSCNVPEGLVSELKIKSINLSQYLQKGGLPK